MNNVIVGTGQAPAGSQPVLPGVPGTGFTNSVVTTGNPAFFSDVAGTTMNFVPAASATDLLGKGATGAAVPMTDIGFDPKCIVKRSPIMVGEVAKGSWWQYDVDIDYIKSIGGVAKCFNPAMRSGAPDIGAYKAGAVTTVAPGSCIPPAPEPVGGSGGMGGGASTSGGAGAASGGIPNASGGTAGAPPNGGGPNAAGMPNAPGGGSSGTSSGVAGSASGGTSMTSGSGGSPSGPPGSAGTSAPGTSGTAGTNAPPSEEGCGCRVAPRPSAPHSIAALGLLGAAALASQRRRKRR
jgi:MYXO-CTERM domain-containing protein